jgi:hypothetical protein
MDQKLIIITVGTWFLFMVLAIINAILRNEVYKPIIGDLRAHQLSTIIFMALILIVTYLVLRFFNLKLSIQQSILIGIIWLVLTVCFEFLAGHYVFGNSWEHLIQDYNILEGRIWSLVLLTIVFAPFISNRLLEIR